MSNWALQIPHRDRGESLIDVASHCRRLDGDDRAVARTIVLDAAVDGLRTAGDLLDRLEGMTAGERRDLLDRARVESGLPPTADVEAVERSAVASKAGSVIAARYGGLTLCHGKTSAGLRCNAIPMTDYGVPRQVQVVAWHCAEHIGQARPGDMDPPPCPWRVAQGGAIIPNDPTDDARADAQAESSSRQHAAVLADREHEATEARATDDARLEQLRRELPPHLQGLVA